jgi:hypothetical protein
MKFFKFKHPIRWIVGGSIFLLPIILLIPTLIHEYLPKLDFPNRTLQITHHRGYECRLKDRIFCDEVNLSLWLYSDTGKKWHLKTYKGCEFVYGLWWRDLRDGGIMLLASGNGWETDWQNRKVFVDTFLVRR